MIASISQPATDTSVPLCLSVSGDAYHVPAGTTLWLFIQVPDQNDHPARWYALAKLKIDSAGRWIATGLQIGDPGGGRPYWLEIFAGEDSRVTLTSRDLGNVALASIPTGFATRPLDTVLVHREDTPSGERCG
jgi:hypothetical protein